MTIHCSANSCRLVKIVQSSHQWPVKINHQKGVSGFSDHTCWVLMGWVQILYLLRANWTVLSSWHWWKFFLCEGSFFIKSWGLQTKSFLLTNCEQTFFLWLTYLSTRICQNFSKKQKMIFFWISSFVSSINHPRTHQSFSKIEVQKPNLGLQLKHRGRSRSSWTWSHGFEC